MSAEILIRAATSGPRFKGEISAIQPPDWVWGIKEQSPEFVHVTVTDESYTMLRQQIAPIRRRLQIEIVSSDPVNDVHRVRIFSDTVRASDQAGAVTQAEVADFLARWNCAFVSEGANEVVFDADIYDLAASPGFFGAEALPNVSFSPVSYDEGTGEHVIDADYSLTELHPNDVSRKAAIGTDIEVISNTGGVIRYSIRRATLRQHFLEDIEHQFKKQLLRRRYRVDPAAVDTAIGNGGAMTVTNAQFQNNLIDILSE